jgi:hypothetical protein
MVKVELCMVRLSGGRSPVPLLLCDSTAGTALTAELTAISGPRITVRDLRGDLPHSAERIAVETSRMRVGAALAI